MVILVEHEYNKLGIDRLVYSYETGGNRLTRVTDNAPTATRAQIFLDGNTTGSDYSYDLNGNMTQDKNKGITQVSYNYLNLPQKIVGTSQTIEYIYSANGQKLQKKAPNDEKTHYSGNFIYEGTSLKQVLHSEGYIDMSGTPTYHYYLKDHLGNNRMVVNQSGTVVQQTDYYPFGMTFNKGGSSDNKYLYNGKEQQTDLLAGSMLDWYDYGARMYDATLGRFHTIDRYSESFMPISPYQYAANNPISYIDFNGDYITIGIQDDNGKQLYSVLYENGKAYHYTEDSKGNITKGDEYDGNSSFVEKAIADLGKIADTKQGGHVVNELVKSSSNYNISNSGDPMVNTFSRFTNEIKYSQTGAGFIDGVSMNKSHIKLGHELAHAYDKDRGFDMSSTMFNGGLPASEINAVRFENYLRAMDGETTMRTRYGSYNISSRIGGRSSGYFKNYIAPLGKYERYRTFYPPSTSEGVDNTRVYIHPVIIRYDTRQNIFKSE